MRFIPALLLTFVFLLLAVTAYPPALATPQTFYGTNQTSLAIFIQLTGSKGSIAGRLQIAVIEGRGPYSLKTFDRSITGVQSGASLHIVPQPRLFQEDAALTGTFQDRTPTLNVPHPDGSWEPIVLQPGTVLDYHHAVQRLRGRVEALNRLYEFGQELRRRRQAIDDTNSVLGRAVALLSRDLQEIPDSIGNMREDLLQLTRAFRAMKDHYDKMRADYQGIVKAAQAKPLSCEALRDIQIGVDTLLRQNLSVTLNYDLDGAVRYHLARIASAYDRYKWVKSKIEGHIQQVQAVFADLETAVTAYPLGSPPMRYSAWEIGQILNEARSLLPLYDPEAGQMLVQANRIHQAARELYRNAEVLYQKAQSLASRLECTDQR